MTFARPRRVAPSSLVTALALLSLLAACNSDKSTGSGPVTVKFTTPVYQKTGVSFRDTVFARVSIDGAPAITAPRDSVVGLARGDHTLDVQYDISYLPQHYTVKVNPPGGTQTVTLVPEGSCRDWSVPDDRPFCVESRVAKNALYWSQHRRVYCAVSDWADFCSSIPSDIGGATGIGAAWPATTTADQYVSQGKLLVAATLGPDIGGSAAGAHVAMSLYEPGDYSPHVRLAPVAGDSSRYFSEVWTDARHVPIYPASTPTLGDLDRAGQNFGLSVRITYAIPQNLPDGVLVRYDLTNISATDSFRFVHPEEPAAGHTLQNVYLVPFVDPNIGASTAAALTGQAEVGDDNATVFPQDSLLAAYDAAFSVPSPNFSSSGGNQQRPGLVGLRLVQGPAGTSARALLLTNGNVLSYATPAAEATTFQYLTGGRANGIPAGCTAVGGSGGVDALLCSSETATDIRMGWSVGPIASLAPGQSTSITVALIFASPVAGTFTSGTVVAPENSSLASTTRQIYDVAGDLRALGASLAGTTVTPAR